MCQKQEVFALTLFLLLATLLAFVPMDLSTSILLFGVMGMCGGYVWGHMRARYDMKGDCRRGYQATRQSDQDDHLRR